MKRLLWTIVICCVGPGILQLAGELNLWSYFGGYATAAVLWLAHRELDARESGEAA